MLPAPKTIGLFYLKLYIGCHKSVTSNSRATSATDPKKELALIVVNLATLQIPVQILVQLHRSIRLDKKMLKLLVMIKSLKRIMLQTNQKTSSLRPRLSD